MKLSDTAPPYCASCFQAGGEKRYIDFEAAYDGPVIPGTPEPVPVDDLILCEDCLSAAFGILDPQGLVEELKAKEGELDAAEEHIKALEREVEGLALTNEELVNHPIRRHRGQRGYQVGDSDVKAFLESRRAERRKKAKKQRERKVPA